MSSQESNSQLFDEFFCVLGRYTESEVLVVLPEDEQSMRQSEQSWIEDSHFDDSELMESIGPDPDAQKMSASLLNKFVEYNANQPNRLIVLTERLLNSDEKLSVNQKFGTLVHAFMRDYLDKVIKERKTNVDDLATDYHQRISWLGYPDEDRSQLHQRLERIITIFLPVFSQKLTETHLAEQKTESILDDIPLSGTCDLLELDEANRTIKIFDYKTGVPPHDNKPSRSQVRQLQFYKLLLESSPEFHGWSVSGGADIFVEPLEERGDCIVEPQFLMVSDAEMGRLRLLLKAVWCRLRNGLFDTSGFEESDHLESLRQSTVDKAIGDKAASDKAASDKASKSKKSLKDDMQEAFELWLIEEYLKREKTV